MIAFLLAAQAAACAPNPPGIVLGAAAQRVDAHVRRLTALGAFDGVVLVARHDTVLIHRGYGWANDATCAPMTPETVFDVGSIAKQYTGAAVLMLEAAGTLHTTDSIGRWLPGVPADKRAITIRDLATHRSGLPRDHADFFARLRPATRDDVVSAALQMSLDAPVGATFSYSNVGYNLLAAIVERASGVSFDAFVRTHEFMAAGLQRTAFVSSARQWTDADVAHPYWDQYDAGSTRDRTSSWYGLGGSQIVTTAGDLYKWVRSARLDHMLPDSSVQKWMQPDPKDTYAFGWNVARRADGTISVIFHDGADTGVGAEVRYYPQRDLTVVVLTNRQHQDQLMHVDLINDVVSLTNGGRADSFPAGEAPSPSRLPDGRYVLGDGSAFTLWRAHGGRLWVAPEGQSAFNLALAQDTAAPRRIALAQRRTTAVIDSLSALSCTGVASAPATPQAVPETLTATWCALRNQLGSPARVDTIGVRLPVWSKDRAFVFVRVHFARGVRAFTWLWETAQLIEVWNASDVAYPQSINAVEESPGVLLLYDYFRGAGQRVQFDTAGAPTLRVSSGTGTLVARRVR